MSPAQRATPSRAWRSLECVPEVWQKARSGHCLRPWAVLGSAFLADDVPVNNSVVIGRNDAVALDNQHISRKHLCISVNYDKLGRALLLAHNVR